MSSPKPQPGILYDAPPLARYLFFQLNHDSDVRDALLALREVAGEGDCVVGLGRMTVQALGADLPALRELQPYVGAGFSMPVTPIALFVWLRGEDRGN
jgi:putative iron-dependent peroxidase